MKVTSIEAPSHSFSGMPPRKKYLHATVTAKGGDMQLVATKKCDISHARTCHIGSNDAMSADCPVLATLIPMKLVSVTLSLVTKGTTTTRVHCTPLRARQQCTVRRSREAQDTASFLSARRGP